KGTAPLTRPRRSPMQESVSRLGTYLLRMRLLVFLLALGASSCAAPVAAVGDSVTWGWGGAPGGWVTELSALTGIPIANLGVPGERAAAAADRMDGPLGLWLAPFARTVLILHGGNDAVAIFANGPC